MQTQSVLIGEIALDNEPRIKLYAETSIPLSKEGLAALKNKLAYLLDWRFRASDPSEPPPYLTIKDITRQYHCLGHKVARLMREGLLHPIVVNDEPRFDPEEVARVMAHN